MPRTRPAIRMTIWDCGCHTIELPHGVNKKWLVDYGTTCPECLVPFDDLPTLDDRLVQGEFPFLQDHPEMLP